MGIWSTCNMDFLETCRDIDLKPATWYLRFGCIWKSWHNGNIRGKHRMSESYAWLCHVSSAGKNPRDQPLGTTPDPEWRTGSVSDARCPFELCHSRNIQWGWFLKRSSSSSNCGNQLREISNCLKNGETYMKVPGKWSHEESLSAHILNPFCWEICMSLLPSFFSPIENML